MKVYTFTSETADVFAFVHETNFTKEQFHKICREAQRDAESSEDVINNIVAQKFVPVVNVVFDATACKTHETNFGDVKLCLKNFAGKGYVKG